MELFIKFINFINTKVSNALIWVGDHTPNFIKNFFGYLSKKVDALGKKREEKYAKFMKWLYGPSKKKKKAPPNYKSFFSFLFSPTIITIMILGGTIYFFNEELAKLAPDPSMDDLAGEMKELRALRAPAFTKFKDREFFVDDIYFPIYIKSTNSIKRLILDLNLRVSNRYIKTFFTDWKSRNLDLIYDRLNLTSEEVVPHFPLTDEGKYIIKRKIKMELDILFKEIGIRGEVEKVFIAQIIGA